MELKRLKIMVIGGAGFIGSHLVDKLLRMGSHVIVYDNLDEYYVGKEDNLRHHLGKSNFMLIKADILDYDVLCKAMKKVDIVFHLAAQPGVRYSLRKPVKTHIVNTTGTLNVLRAAKENSIKRMIYASSSSVYGNAARLPIKEDYPKNPISPYGVSKLAAEYYCRVYHQTYNMDIVILRYFTVYGPRQRPDMAIHKFTTMITNDQPPIIYGDGKQTRDFTYVEDTVVGTIIAAEVDDVSGETINLGSGKRVTVNRLVKILLRMLHKEDMEPVYAEAQPGDVKHTLADISKAKKRLGYQPKTTIKGLKNFVDWFLNDRKADQ